MRTRLAAALTAGALGLAGLGASLALPLGASATSTGTATTDSSTTDDSATDDSATEADRQAGFASRILEALAGLVSDGTITQDQAQAVADTLAAQGPPDGGRGGHGGGGPGMGGRIGGADLLATAAETLGVTEDELHTSLEGGSTLADVAGEEGVEVQTLIDALVAARTEAIDAAVTAGTLTEDKATELKANLTDRITTMVNEGFRGGPGHGRGMGQDSSTGTDAVTSSV